jgi:hypothetical protein
VLPRLEPAVTDPGRIAAPVRSVVSLQPPDSPASLFTVSRSNSTAGPIGWLSPDDPTNQFTPARFTWTVSGSVSPVVAGWFGLAEAPAAKTNGTAAPGRWIWQVSLGEHSPVIAGDRSPRTDRHVVATARTERFPQEALTPKQIGSIIDLEIPTAEPTRLPSDEVAHLLARFAAEAPPGPSASREVTRENRRTTFTKRFLWIGMITTASLLKLCRIRLNIASFTVPRGPDDRWRLSETDGRGDGAAER